jgi:hypothetical protein
VFGVDEMRCFVFGYCWKNVILSQSNCGSLFSIGVESIGRNQKKRKGASKYALPLFFRDSSAVLIPED